MSGAESLGDARRQAEDKLGVRELAHQKLDVALDMYLAGAPLWITTSASWFTRGLSDHLSITIREEHP